MPCYHPLSAWYSQTCNASGKRSIVFSRSQGFVDLPLQLPCGQCIGCRLERSRQWAIRCVHEASLYDRNCFITLTFSPQFLPKNGSLLKSDFQKFLKRLRRAFPDDTIRYFHCGEYGDLLSRPHHHACIFGFDFTDKILWSVRGGVRLYRSAALERLWSDPKSGLCFGFCTVGEVTFDSAAYVARYVAKKITGDFAAAHYGDKLPEYITMSRRPGIGRAWIERYIGDVYPRNKLALAGKRGECKPPRYYEAVYDVDYPDHPPIIPNDCSFKVWNTRYRVKCGHVQVVPEDPKNTPDRLEVREFVATKTLTEKKRSYEL